ncbi:Galectin-1 [Aquarana catesbeiana]|uniref:Galectin n=1 Tax=Aquarana catesbeiana TaxID=8400 RepID=A0A2G9RU01_AQUCT|nr:Galectin-1 [Aquarana catesbeiana]
MAADGVVLNHLNLQSGHCVEVKAIIPEGCKGFAINLGKDHKNYLLHFNARFDLHGDTHKIVCNSKEDNAWGVEQRESFFPFQEGSETSICFKYDKDKINVQLSSGENFSFPARFPSDVISFLSLEGIQLKCLTLE